MTPQPQVQLRTEQVQVAAIDPAEHPEFTEPHVMLVLLALPMHPTPGPVPYTTAFTPEVAIALGEGLAQAGHDALKFKKDAPASSRLVTATNMAEAHQVAQAASKLRRPTG